MLWMWERWSWTPGTPEIHRGRPRGVEWICANPKCKGRIPRSRLQPAGASSEGIFTCGRILRRTVCVGANLLGGRASWRSPALEPGLILDSPL